MSNFAFWNVKVEFPSSPVQLLKFNSCISYIVVTIQYSHKQFYNIHKGDGQILLCGFCPKGGYKKIKEGKFCSVAPNEWLVLYINSCSGAGLLEDCQGLPGEDCDGDWGDWCPAQEVGETVAKETQMSELYNDCWSVFVVKCWNIWILCTSNISDYIPKITQGW